MNEQIVALWAAQIDRARTEGLRGFGYDICSCGGRHGRLRRLILRLFGHHVVHVPGVLDWPQGVVETITIPKMRGLR